MTNTYWAGTIQTYMEAKSIAVFGITFRSRTRTAKSNEQLENGCLLVKFWKPFVNLFPPSDGRGNFGAFSTCSRHENHFPYWTRKIPNSACRRINSRCLLEPIWQIFVVHYHCRLWEIFIFSHFSINVLQKSLFLFNNILALIFLLYI